MLYHVNKYVNILIFMYLLGHLNKKSPETLITGDIETHINIYLESSRAFEISLYSLYHRNALNLRYHDFYATNAQEYWVRPHLNPGGLGILYCYAK